MALRDPKDEKRIQQILNYLLLEKNLTKRVDFLYDHELLRYGNSEKKSLIQLADECFGEKLSGRSKDQTLRLFEKLATRNITEQGINKLENAFYVVMNSEEKMPEAFLKLPITSLKENLPGLALEEAILKDLAVEELKDLLVFLAAAKFDFQQLSKDTCFVDDSRPPRDAVCQVQQGLGLKLARTPRWRPKR